MYGSERKYHKGTMDTKAPTTHTSANPPLDSTQVRTHTRRHAWVGYKDHTTKANSLCESMWLSNLTRSLQLFHSYLIALSIYFQTNFPFLLPTFSYQSPSPSGQVFNWKRSYLFTCQLCFNKQTSNKNTFLISILL